MQTVDVFGPGRCMFGSNFPVEKPWTSYADLIEVFTTPLAQLTQEERRQILHDVAAGVYRLDRDPV